MKNPLKPSIKPIVSPATREPSRLLYPPRITTTKAINEKRDPTVGKTKKRGIRTAPAAPTAAIPIPKS